jgi:hypothetical protein
MIDFQKENDEEMNVGSLWEKFGWKMANSSCFIGFSAKSGHR